MRALKILLLIWLYAGWFVCVYAVKYDLVACTPLVPLLALGLLWVTEKPSGRMVLTATGLIGVGLVLDTLSYNLGALRFDPEFVKPFLPLWFVSIWLLFIPGILILRNIFGSRYWIAGLLGAVVGPASYRSGEGFGVLYFTHPGLIAVYALAWGVFMSGGIYVLNRVAANSMQVRN